MAGVSWVAVLLIGAVVGFAGGLFGKGGSALATPLLAALGVPPIIALASPLPAVVPSTLVATWAYWRRQLLEPRIVVVSLAVGAPLTVAGALISDRIGGAALVTVTEAAVAALGLRLLVRPMARDRLIEPVGHRAVRVAVVAATAGFLGGLLANSGGFLLAPLFLVVLRLDVKTAFACSLAVSAGLAVPGTIAHALLGHVDWALVAGLAVTSVPASYAGARLALRTEAVHLERAYGLVLALAGTVLLLTHR